MSTRSSARRRRNHSEADFEDAGTSPMHSCTSAGTGAKVLFVIFDIL